MAHYCEPRAGADYTCELVDSATWYALGGDAENAIRVLDKSVNIRDLPAVMMPFEAAFVPLRSDPRFQRLMAAIHPGSD
jgi:hypothetical protein